MTKAPQPKDHEPIRLTFTKAGQPRYRVRVDGDPHPATGKRRQVWSTHDTLTAARAHVEAHRTDRKRGTLLTPDRQSFATYAAAWHASRSLEVREVTANAYRSCLNRADAAFGAKPLRAVSRTDVEALIAQLAEAGRSKRTASLTLFVVRSVFEDALHEGLIVRNPAARVKARGASAKVRTALSRADYDTLCSHLASDRLYACWLLTLAGLRRSELLGLRWSDVDLTAETLTIARSRVLVDGKHTAEHDPKTEAGARTLPLRKVPHVLAALRAMRQTQLAEFGAEQARSGYLAVDEIGRPVRHERWSDEWREHCATAGVDPVTLHEARHSSVTLMLDAGVEPRIVAKLHGHTVATMFSHYDHPSEDAMADGLAALAPASRATS